MQGVRIELTEVDDVLAAIAQAKRIAAATVAMRAASVGPGFRGDCTVQ